MLYTVFVSLMQTIKGKYIGKKATKNTDHRSYQSSKILKCTVSAFNAFLILKTHVIMTFFNVFCMNMFPLGVVFLEISRRCNDQSVVRMMTITKNSQLYTLVLWILDYGHHFDEMTDWSSDRLWNLSFTIPKAGKYKAHESTRLKKSTEKIGSKSPNKTKIRLQMFEIPKYSSNLSLLNFQLDLLGICSTYLEVMVLWTSH